MRRSPSAWPPRQARLRRDRPHSAQHEHAVEAPLQVRGDRIKLTGKEPSGNRSQPALDGSRQLDRLPLDQARAGSGRHSRPTYLAPDSVPRGAGVAARCVLQQYRAVPPASGGVVVALAAASRPRPGRRSPLYGRRAVVAAGVPRPIQPRYAGSMRHERPDLRRTAAGFIVRARPARPPR